MSISTYDLNNEQVAVLARLARDEKLLELLKSITDGIVYGMLACDSTEQLLQQKGSANAMRALIESAENCLEKIKRGA